MTTQYMNLNIRYDAPQEIWDKISSIYSQMDGWLGFATADDPEEPGIPYWFSFSHDEKHIDASVEPSGLSFSGLMEESEWKLWCAKIKRIATRELGYKVGEIENGEVDY